ncbi:MAG: gliding motility-associated C-terminal domain-containing protein, partial [Flavobacteriales bacterium]|nr:gliding motility-associated C-terminal domain-containing protein [Flavobacteriales bacterium]
SGGTSPYSYEWDGGQTDDNIGGENGGIQGVTVTDNNGCKMNCSSYLFEPTELTLVLIDPIDPSCEEGDGGLTADASGGTSPYSYQWSYSNTETGTQAITLDQGIYTVTVTDFNGCFTDAIYTLLVPGAPVINLDTVINPSCTGFCDGGIRITGSGGTPGYVFEWDNGDTDEDRTTLCEGTYTVTITDTEMCSSPLVIVLEDPIQLTLSVTNDTNICYGYALASIAATATEGTVAGDYNYLWSNGDTEAATISGLIAGTYGVTITDDNGCSITGQGEVAEPTQLVSTIGSTQPRCFNDCDGTISVNPSGGTPARVGGVAVYNYLWSNDSITQNRDSLCGALDTMVYSVIITDDNGCSIALRDSIINPEEVEAIIINPLDGATSTSPFEIDFINGSRGANTYFWTFGDRGNFSTLTDPTYSYQSVTSKDYQIILLASRDGFCEDLDTVQIHVICEDTLYAPDVFTPNGDDFNEKFMVTHRGLLEIRGVIFNRWGEKLFEWHGAETGWDARTMAGEEVPDGVYFYLITGKGCTGETYNLKSSVTIIR